jgi:RNA polymerase sigma factor (TIGR02999 family)
MALASAATALRYDITFKEADRAVRGSNVLSETHCLELSRPDVTELLLQWSQGDKSAEDRLLPLVYDELRRRAASYLRRERPGHTLQATALVHETYLALVNQRRVHWQNRAHFIGLAAQLMRRILVEHARRHHAAKRGGDKLQVTLDDALELSTERDLDLVALDESLTALHALDPQQSRIVELRFFGGLTVDETAAALGVSARTVDREWRMAKAWLKGDLARGEQP